MVQKHFRNIKHFNQTTNAIFYGTWNELLPLFYGQLNLCINHIFGSLWPMAPCCIQNICGNCQHREDHGRNTNLKPEPPAHSCISKKKKTWGSYTNSSFKLYWAPSDSSWSSVFCSSSSSPSSDELNSISGTASPVNHETAWGMISSRKMELHNETNLIRHPNVINLRIQ